MKDLDDFSMLEDEEEVFEGRFTFPEEKSQETNDCIIRYIKEKYPECDVRDHGHAPYCHENEGNKEISKTGSDVKIVLSGLKYKWILSHIDFRPSGRLSAIGIRIVLGVCAYPGEDDTILHMVLRGEKFEELDKIMKILYS